jgi:peptidoglycan hydrolase CwlO-like protein
MKKFVVFLLVLVLAVGVLSYWRGWFSVTKEGAVDVQVDSAKFKQDKDAFSKTVGAKASAIKDQVAGLWKKSEGLTGDAKAKTQKDLGALQEKHDRLDQQIKDLDDAGADRFQTIKADLTKSLEEVDARIEALTKQLDRAHDSAHAPEPASGKE